MKLTSWGQAGGAHSKTTQSLEMMKENDFGEPCVNARAVSNI